MNEIINKLFDNLDLWRHFPAYQLERRADIFFSIYLPEFLKEERGYDVQAIIPEFPIRVGTIHTKRHINKSFKVDYLVKINNPSRVIFIELKTDKSSRRPEQDWYLKAAKKAGMQSLLDGLKKIYEATNSKRKYKHLLANLEVANLIKMHDEERFEILNEQNEITILYLQPLSTEGENTISFAEFANYVGKKDDKLSQRFSRSLFEWASSEA